MKSYVANSQATLALDDHKLTIGVSSTRKELSDRFDVVNEMLPGSEPAIRISHNDWVLLAEGGWNINDFILVTSARMDQDDSFGTHITPKMCGNRAFSND